MDLSILIKISNLLKSFEKMETIRDDSGIYYSIGKFKSILAVDTNSINFFSLPNNITFLASSFFQPCLF